jgi:hypothetical protein
VLVATATIRVVATEGQIYGRQLQQAGDYTGPHRDPLRNDNDQGTAGPGIELRKSHLWFDLRDNDFGARV